MTNIVEPLTEDEDLETLLEQVAEANPEAEEVREFVYRGQSMEMIEVHGVNTDDVNLPDSPEGEKFDIQATQPVHPEDEETRQKLIDEGYAESMEDFEPPFEPAWISFSRDGEA